MEQRIEELERRVDHLSNTLQAHFEALEMQATELQQRDRELDVIADALHAIHEVLRGALIALPPWRAKAPGGDNL